MTRLYASTAVVALAATVGDYAWYEFGVRHRMWVGVLHGAVLLTAVGGAIGAASGRIVAGLPIGTVAGIIGALIYYATVRLLGGQTAMIVAWAALWIVLALLDARFVRRGARPIGQALLQGASAAVLSGVTFYLVVGTLWGRAPAGGRNYLMQFAAWLIAWAPGILAIGQELRRARPQG